MTFEEWTNNYYKSKMHAKFSKYNRIAKQIALAAYKNLPHYAELKNKQGREELEQVASMALLQDLKRLYTDESIFNKNYDKKKDDITIGPFYLKGNHNTIKISKKDTASIKYIKYRVIDELRKYDPLSPSERHQINKVKKFTDDFYKKNGDYPSVEELEEGLKMDIKSINKILGSDLQKVEYKEYMESVMKNINANIVRSSIEILESGLKYNSKYERDIIRSRELSTVPYKKKDKVRLGILESVENDIDSDTPVYLERSYESDNQDLPRLYEEMERLIYNEKELLDNNEYESGYITDLLIKYAMDKESLSKNDSDLVKKFMDYAGLVLFEEDTIDSYYISRYLYYPERSKISKMDIAFLVQKLVMRLNGLI